MRIAVTRTGGFAGRVLRGALETAGRPDAARLEALGHRALAAPPNAAGAGAPDGFRYRITVGDRAADCAEPHLTDAQRALVRLVLAQGAGPDRAAGRDVADGGPDGEPDAGDGTDRGRRD